MTKFKIFSVKMILHKSIPLIILIILNIHQPKLVQSCDNCNKTYVPPCNMKYPYGDENQMNMDMTQNDTNMVLCEDKTSYVPEYGRCPFPPTDPDAITDPYIRCPVFPPLPGPSPAPEGATLSSAYTLCQSCDVKLTPEGSAVNLKCVECHDFPSTERTAELGAKNLTYVVYFLEIANYTSVNVQGRENFNP